MGTTLRMGEPPVTDHGAPAVTASIKATTRQRTRLRVQTVNDAGWPHARLSIPTDEIDVHLTLSLTELDYAVAALIDARDALRELYEPGYLQVVGS